MRSRVNSGNRPAETPPSHLERAARESLDLRVGRPLTDSEWSRARGLLLEFARILCDWGPKTDTAESELDEAALN
jgi:hypothetical protein